MITTAIFLAIWLVACWRMSRPRMLKPHPAQLLTGRPATRVGRYLLFEGGYVVRLTRIEQVLYALGHQKSLSTRTNERSKSA